MSDISHTVVFFFKFIQLLGKNSANLIDIIQDICFGVVVDTGNTCCTGKRMTAVGQTTGKCMIVKICGDLFADTCTTKLNVATGNTLCKGYDIRFDIKIHKSKHFTSSAPASHNLITDHDNAKLITELTHALQISLRRNDNTVCTGYGFQNDRCDLIPAFIDDLLTQLCDIKFRCSFL